MVQKSITFASIFFILGNVNAQVDSLKMNIDFRTRAELDNGARTIMPKGKSPETTIASRARFGIDYYYKNLELYISAQDTRTWGETSSNASKNQNFILNEAWAKYQVSEKFSLKLGRQILSYDNERLIGTLDWMMQGRSFDALKGIYKLSPNSKLETVVTYNNDDNDLNDFPDKVIYTISEAGEITKSLQVIHYQHIGKKNFEFSAIAMNNILQNPSGTHYDMLTVGINTKKYLENIGFFGSAYYQTGKNTLAQSKNAYQFSANIDFILHPKFNFVLGTEWLSGKNYDTESSKNKSFSPLYGTNHLYNGYMDYFYFGTSHFNSFGLNDYYLKSNLKFSQNSLLQANLHVFTSNGKMGYSDFGQKISTYLGTELDFVFTHKVGKMITANVGHSFMFSGESMKFLKNVSDPKNLQTWTWVGLKIMPNFRLK
ncbi:alginate export family protein [Chryseobacterium sp. Ch-15]|uniref:Alginate export family protein n=1 Tax=Chryseobacterium muglaense TaxID=2893752 RepID=A0A9Q3UTJ0_9FLAO|nr:alginate export family protein [Chryseobacterium muglaense]MBD3906337.1 alginate export family protein [Chryseobacterium muglaense]MCC9033104.1 alginate export family protein [Chryseobacterium muglaense]MCM2556035.1 alginate export family protein [Chryseobacterium muglaense]